MSKELPDLHKQAHMFKNSKRFQHDGGRAWIKDSQLHEARKKRQRQAGNHSPQKGQRVGRRGRRSQTLAVGSL